MVVEKLVVKCPSRIKKIAEMDGIPVSEEFEIAVALYCTIRGLTPQQQEFIDGYIQRAVDGHIRRVINDH